MIAHNTDRLGALVRDVLHVVRIEAGELVYDLAPVDLAALTQEYASDLRLAGTERVSVRVDGEIPLAHAHAERQRQILANLVSNALKFLFICKMLVEGQGGTITVESVPGAGTTFRYTVPLEAAQG